MAGSGGFPCVFIIADQSRCFSGTSCPHELCAFLLAWQHCSEEWCYDWSWKDVPVGGAYVEADASGGWVD